MTNRVRKIVLPLSQEVIDSLHAGDPVSLNGVVYSARDAAHARMVESLKQGESFGFSLLNSVIYYMGPSPARPGKPIGAAGPTTSGRMDSFTPFLLRKGLKGMIGKGQRLPQVVSAIRECGAVYFVATGGAGALLGQSIKMARIVAYDDLGPEAIRELMVKDFRCWVAIDRYGVNVFDQGV